ncbi:MAG: SPFH domain-containing protein [Planctomycetes bacterium]|nr:SPFH domain-containing protein [Planctomycetota bacterium]
MALDILEFFDESGEIIVARQPAEGSGQFQLGSQLVIQESQLAAFFRDGRCLDMFQAGRHTLTTQNLPLLTKLIGLSFGDKSPFRSYVYFLATKTFVNLGWGTSTPVVFRDTDLRMVALRAHGSYSIRLRDPRVFLTTIVGTRGLETTVALTDFFRTAIVSRLNEGIGERMKSILDLPVLYSEIGLAIKQAVRTDFEQYGIELVDLLIEAVTVPLEVQKMIDRASGVAAQDADKYRAIAAADALRDAAQNPGTSGAALGAGLGLGAGAALGQELVTHLRPLAHSDPPGSGTDPAGAGHLTAEELKGKFRVLKQLMEDGLISESDFEGQKQRLLAQV